VTSNWSDVVVVGGGIAGSALAAALARHGLGVTVLEQEHEYRDRVRGEYLPVWGVAEAQRLDLADILRDTGGTVVRWRVPYDEAWSAAIAEASARDNSQILPGVLGAYCGSHPAACRTLSRAAEDAGAVFVRGVGDVRVSSGAQPEVCYRVDGVERRVRCRLVVGADGRRSVVREQTGIMLHTAGPTHLISGLLVDDVPEWPQDTSSSGTQGDVMFLVFPQGGARLRLYLCTSVDQRHRFAGRDGPQRFLDEFRRLSCLPWAPAVVVSRPIGPCATFPGDDTWTESPIAAPGVVLVGDAAGYNDPIIGQGLAIALRDARILGDLLVAQPEWDSNSLAPYAQERSERMRRLQFTASLVAALQADFSPGARDRRARFYQRMRAGTDTALRIPLAAATAGPETVPRKAFTREMRDHILGAPAVQAAAAPASSGVFPW
jgi:2-polyprenyl-6-methoxyphenol hydroxylase-like FAD-dependent oxidoreductase